MKLSRRQRREQRRLAKLRAVAVRRLQSPPPETDHKFNIQNLRRRPIA